MGDHRLPARARHRGAAVHLGAAPVGRQTAVDDGTRRLPRRLGRLKPGVERRFADRLARRAGRGRRHHVPAADHADHAGRRRQGPRQDRHRHRAARAARPHTRPARRRRDPHPPQLAVHVLGERAVLRRRAHPRRALPARRQA